MKNCFAFLMKNEELLRYAQRNEECGLLFLYGNEK